MNRRAASLAQITMFHFRELYRNKIALFFNLMFPLLMVVIFGTLFRTPEQDAATAIGFVNEGESGLSFAVQQALIESGRFHLHEGGVAALSDALKAGKVRAVVVLPSASGAQWSTVDGTVAVDAPDAAGTNSAARAESAAGIHPPAVDIIHDPLSPTSARAANELRAFINSLGVYMTGVQPAFVSVTRPMQGSAKRDLFDYIMPGMMTVMLLASGLTTVSVTVSDQRSSGALRHLFSTPMSVGVWTTGRVTANLLMALVQGMLLFAFARIVFGVSGPANLPGTVAVVGVSSLMILGIGLLIGSWAKDDDAAVAVSMPVMMVLMFLGNAAMPLEDPPAFIAAIVRWVPTFHVTEAMRAVMRDGQGLAAIGGELLLISGLAALLLGTAIWRMRRQFVLSAD